MLFRSQEHIPEWRKAEEMHKGQDWETETEADQKEMDSVAENVGMEAMQEEEPLRSDYEVKKRHQEKTYTSSTIEQTAGSVMKVEDLFSQSNELDEKRKSLS